MATRTINIEKIKEEIVRKLKPLEPEKIIIFGSYAYGEPLEDSDLDICVVKKEVKKKIKMKQKIRELLKDIKIAKDILVPNKDEYDFYKKEIGSVYREIENKGELLWKNT